MCDYSLMAIPNRLAIEGDELIVHRFSTGSLGFASPRPPCRGLWPSVKAFFQHKPVTVVCIPPGGRLMLRDIPVRLQVELKVGLQEEVVFTELTAAAHRYRDAVRFSNGQEVLLQHLSIGQHARVLDVSSLAGIKPILEEQIESPFRLVSR